MPASIHEQSALSTYESIIEFHCNICKKILPSQKKLEEHLIEHSFQGCDDRGYTCYICSAVFTSPAGLHQHMPEHGLNSRPYDCNLCTEKFFFRAELENHMIDHENGHIIMPVSVPTCPPPSSMLYHKIDLPKTTKRDRSNSNDKEIIVKIEKYDKDVADDKDIIKPDKTHTEDSNDKNECEDDEYIEIEQLGEHASADFSNSKKSDERNTLSDNETDGSSDNEKMSSFKKNIDNNTTCTPQSSP